MTEDQELDLLVEIELSYEDLTMTGARARTKLIRQFCAAKGFVPRGRNAHNDRIAFMDKHYLVWRGYSVE